MRKIATLILASLMLISTHAFAEQANATTGDLPKVLTDLGITHEDLQDIDTGIVDHVTNQEADILRHRGGGRGPRGRYCPRGYHLKAYRIRIGRFVIVRYRCVRNRRHWDYQNPAQHQSVPAQTIE